MTDENRIAATQAESSIIRTILEGTSAQTGTPFMRALVKSLASALQTSCAWVTEYLEEKQQLRALAFWREDGFVDHYQYDLYGTPCERAIQQRALVHIPERVIELYPYDNDLVSLRAVSYMGAPLLDDDQTIVGHLAVLHTKEMPYQPQLEWLFQIFAARAGAELRRMRAEAAVQQREEQLRQLFDSTMDALIQVDDRFVIKQVNSAAQRIFGTSAEHLIGKVLADILAESSAARVQALARELSTSAQARPHVWIADRLEGVTARDVRFPAEASLSTYKVHGQICYTLVLRNILDQVEANRKISTLKVEKAYLQEELDQLRNLTQIIGQSPAMQGVFREIAQVAPTDATVLLFGQTGTGKEMVARAIHEASRRVEHLMVTVNCAAIPANLIESELFGHEKGAFTGASQPRKGRFALAEGGTIFLDEIGELPLDLQSKLLRVLQERTFEPVGSSKTCRVDVRVIAATNRDLKKEVAAGRFREDLYYRINVFPITLPPLRERGEDIVLLAESFAVRFAAKIGKTVKPLDDDCRRRLLAYDWPGNVRELQNVIERAVIMSPDGKIRVEGMLSVIEPSAIPTASGALSANAGTNGNVLTVQELLDLERSNILRALDQTGWRISGAGGAARLLGMKPSTLTSRVAALGLKRT